MMVLTVSVGVGKNRQLSERHGHKNGHNVSQVEADLRSLFPEIISGLCRLYFTQVRYAKYLSGANTVTRQRRVAAATPHHPSHGQGGLAALYDSGH